MSIARPVAVSVPVRNERAALPAFMAAIAAQRGAGPFALCLHFDGCTDGSEAVARAHGAGLTLVTGVGAAGPAPNAGRARRAAMALGLAALGGAADGLLLTTDADSLPAPEWVAAATASLASCDVVAGRIVREASGADPALDRLEQYYDRLYAYRRAVDPVPWEPRPGHHFTGGANLGFRASAYRRAGGFPELPAGEDARIVDEAARAGLRVRRDPAPVVQTSARRDGRAVGGLATWLGQHDAHRGEAMLPVGDPAAAAWQYRRHAAARAAFGRLPDAAAELGAGLSLTADHVVGVWRDCPNAEAFAMRIVPAAPAAGRTLPLVEAERVLAGLERALLERAA